MPQHPQLATALKIASEVLASPLSIYWSNEETVIVDGWMIRPDCSAWSLSKPDGSNWIGNHATAESAVMRLLEQVAGERFRDTFTARQGRIVTR